MNVRNVKIIVKRSVKNANIYFPNLKVCQVSLKVYVHYERMNFITFVQQNQSIYFILFFFLLCERHILSRGDSSQPLTYAIGK